MLSLSYTLLLRRRSLLASLRRKKRWNTLTQTKKEKNAVQLTGRLSKSSPGESEWVHVCLSSKNQRRQERLAGVAGTCVGVAWVLGESANERNGGGALKARKKGKGRRRRQREEEDFGQTVTN